MIVSELPPLQFRRTLRQGLPLRIGPFTIRVQSPLSRVAEGVRLLYGDYLIDDTGFTDFFLRVDRPASLRRWVRPQAVFSFDGKIPFNALPLNHAFPFFEWGMNWAIANHVHDYLILHSAVIEKNGRAAILPAPPGSGKSTLCAALVNEGWRLLSDELAIITLDGRQILPIPRPVSLKNESIEVISRRYPRAVLGPSARDTAKGTVAHMKAPYDSIVRSDEPATPAWIVFPKFVPGAPLEAEPLPQAQAFMQVADNGFNYSLLGSEGFHALGNVIDQCDCFAIRYGILDEVLAFFDRLPMGAGEANIPPTHSVPAPDWVE